ncbi:hypothetical protein As57867_015334, partial [Aphanomyces stellatus]
MSEIFAGVYCLTNATESPWQVSYAIDNSTRDAYDVVLDFTGSTNVVVQATNTLQTTLHVGSYARASAEVVRVSAWNRCAICFNYSSNRVNEVPGTSGDDMDHTTRTQETLYTIDLDHQIHYVDASFPPQRSSLGPTYMKVLPLVWKHYTAEYERPFPLLRSDGAASTLIGGDDLFVSLDMKCALRILAERPDILSNLFFTHKGYHKVSLHRQGQPIRVLVDGYIPCLVGGCPVLMKCLEGAAWPLLLQKAYSKLHGGYSQVLSIPVSQILEECFGYPRIEFGRIPGGDGLELAHRMRVVLQFGHMVYVTLNINNKSTHDTVVLRVDVDASNLPTA